MKLLLCLLVFSIAWPISARRVTRDVAQLAVATGLQVIILVIVAVLLPEWVWKSVLLLNFVFPRIGATIQVWRRMREPAELRLVPFTGEAEGMTGAALATFAGRVKELRRAGFEHLGRWIEIRPQVSTLRAMHVHPQTHELASVILMAGSQAGRAGQLMTRITVAAADGRRLMVTDHAVASAPGLRAVYLPTVRNPGRLRAVLRALWERDYAGVPTVPLLREGEGVEAFLVRETRAAMERGVTAGVYRRVEDGSYGYTLRGALAASWDTVFPLPQLRELWARARERRLLRGLGLAETPRDGVPRISIGPAAVAEMAVLAVIAILLLPIPDRLPGLGAGAARARPAAEAAELPARLPDDFAVPADYPGAVRALERLAGARAEPMVLHDREAGTSDTVKAFAAPVHTRRAGPLLAAAAPLFRARGFMLFRHDQTFGIGGQPEALVLYPRYDPYGAMRAVGTNGANYDIGTDSVVSWLAALHRNHPFTVTGIGYDHVEGRFARELTPRQAADVARRLYALCPDVVTQGTGSVRELEREIRKARTLYCWWD
jgi:hypothetical protein